MSLHWKMGVELELLAPVGVSRKTLAEDLAERCGGEVRRIFHPQSEPAKVPGTPVFENLTLGFEVLDQEGMLHARCVDDLTLQQDLNRSHPPREDWYRLLSDDPRILRLMMEQCDPEAPLESVLCPLASLFGTEVLPGEQGVQRVVDRTGASVALGARLPGERERPCELISPPMIEDHRMRLEALLEPARALGFTLPAEGAVHLHFDAERLCSARAISNLVHLLWDQAESLRAELGTNPACVRLGPWPPELLGLVSSVEFLKLPWTLAREALSQVRLTKYCDFNLLNLVQAIPHKHTFEVRILPPAIHADPVVDIALRMQEFLDRAIDPRPVH